MQKLLRVSAFHGRREQYPVSLPRRSGAGSGVTPGRRTGTLLSDELGREPSGVVAARSPSYHAVDHGPSRATGGDVDLIEHSSEERITRESAAQRLRQLADELSRHNEVSFDVEGLRHTVKVPNELTYSLEIEVGDDGSEIEVELKW